MAVLADLGGVDVGVNHLGLWRKGVQLPGDPVVEAGAEGDDQVTALQGRDRRDGAVHAGHAEVLAVAVREGSAGHQGGDDRDSGQLGQFLQLLGRLAADDAAADVEDRLARGGDQLARLFDLAAVRPGIGLVAGEFQVRRPGEGALALQNVLGNVDQDSARAAGGGDVECLGEGAGDVVAVANQEVVLGDRHGDAGDVGLLERIRADQAATHLTCDGDDRDGVHLCVGQRSDEVGGTRTGGGHHDADPAGGVGVSAGGVARPLLVTNQDVADLRRVEQRVVNR